MKIEPITAGEYAIVLHNSNLDYERRLVGLVVTAVQRAGLFVDDGHYVCNAWRVECSIFPSHVIYIDARALWPTRLPSNPVNDRMRHKLDLLQFENELAQNHEQRWSVLVPRTKVYSTTKGSL